MGKSKDGKQYSLCAVKKKEIKTGMEEEVACWRTTHCLHHWKSPSAGFRRTLKKIKEKKWQGYSESSSPASLGDHDAILLQYQRSENFSFPPFPLEEDSDEIEKNFSLEIKFRVFVVTWEQTIFRIEVGFTTLNIWKSFKYPICSRKFTSQLVCPISSRESTFLLNKF